MVSKVLVCLRENVYAHPVYPRLALGYSEVKNMRSVYDHDSPWKSDVAFGESSESSRPSACVTWCTRLHI